MQLTDPRAEQLTLWLKDKWNESDIVLSVVSGDASFRRYFRFTMNQQSYIAVDAPPEKENSQAFIDVSQAYLENGVKVPKVMHSDMTLGFMCLEDFGDDLLFPFLTNETVNEWYLKALAVLPNIQSVESTPSGKLPKFDRALLMNEMSLFTDWLLPKYLNITLTEQEKNVVKLAFENLANTALSQPQVGVHRDYHSRNIMVLADNELGVIDYQDAVLGPITYDAVSLLRDCYVVWPDKIVYELLSEYQHLMVKQGLLDSKVGFQEFKRWFDFMGMQRHLKASGIFARLFYRDGKEGYLKDVPRTVEYIVRVGSHYPEFDAFVSLIENKIKPALQQKSNTSEIDSSLTAEEA